MQFAAKSLLQIIRQRFEAILPDWDGKVDAREPDMLEIIHQAKQEWLASQRYFNSVSDPDLIDHAIMLTDASQKKYMYLLRQAKKQGLRAFSLQPTVATASEIPCLPIQIVGQVTEP